MEYGLNWRKGKEMKHMFDFQVAEGNRQWEGEKVAFLKEMEKCTLKTRGQKRKFGKRVRVLQFCVNYNVIPSDTTHAEKQIPLALFQKEQIKG